MYQLNRNEISGVLWKLKNEGFLSEEEKKMLQLWLSESAHNQKVFDEVMDKESWNKDLQLLLKRDSQAIWNKISPKIEATDPVPVVSMRARWYKYAAAVVVGVTLLGATFYLVERMSQKDIAKTTGALDSFIADVPPGGNKATLTLSDGSSIFLDGGANSEFTRKGLSKFNKVQDGELVYDAANSNENDQLPLTFNVLSTPKGGQYKLVLQDGSKVWLNAASSLRYPVSFNGAERAVELTGEAYFEIAPAYSGQSGKNHHRVPFYLKANGMNVEVLGTHFNVMAYKEEAEMSATLLEGAIKVSKGTETCLLKPGQQAVVANEGKLPIRPIRKLRVVDNAGTEEIIAWKNGYFHFKSATIETVMNQISRWYNVGVVYRGTKTKDHYSGKISRNTNLLEVLSMLKFSGINAKLNGKTIEVTFPNKS